MREGRSRLRLAAALLALLATTALGQGDSPRTGEEFCAPRTMTIPFEAAKPARWNTWVSVTDLKDNYCNNVAIVELRSRAQKTREGKLLVTFKVTTYTRPGHDKRASVTIEVVSGDETLGSTVIDRVDAEENKNARGSSVLYMPLDKATGQASLDLRVSIEAVDD